MLLSHTAQREGELLTFLRGELALSSGLVKRLKWQNAFQLNGAFVHINASVRRGDRIIVDLSEYVQGYDAEDTSLDILYEDEGCLAVEKKDHSGYADGTIACIEGDECENRSKTNLLADEPGLQRLPCQGSDDI